MFSECLLCTDHSLSMKRKILTCSPRYIFNQPHVIVYIIPLSAHYIPSLHMIQAPGEI